MKGEKGEWKISKYAIKRFFIALFNKEIKSAFYSDIPEILRDFEYLNNLCKQYNIALYNVSEGSSLRMIQDFKYVRPDQINKIS